MYDDISVWGYSNDYRAQAIYKKAKAGAAEALKALYDARSAEEKARLEAEKARLEIERKKAEREAKEAESRAIKERLAQLEKEEWERVKAETEMEERKNKPYVPQATTGRNILKEVCLYRKMPVRAVLSEDRSRDIVAVRHEAAYWMRAKVGLSLPQIARIIGGRDHTTILNSCIAYANKHGLPQVVRKGKIGARE